MRLPDLCELAEMYSDPEKGILYFVYRYSLRDKLFGAKGKYGVGRSYRRQVVHLGYFDCARDVRAFFKSLHKGSNV